MSIQSQNADDGPLSSAFYAEQVNSVETRLKYASDAIAIPLQEEGEELDIDSPTDLPDDPEEIATVLINEGAQLQHWFAVARGYASIGKFLEADSIVKKAQNQSLGNSDETHGFLAWLNILRGETSNDSTCWDNARIEIKTALESNSQDDNQFNLLADAVLNLTSKKDKGKKTKFDVETKIFDQLLTKNSKNLYALMGKAKIYFYKQQYLPALKIFQRILQLNPLLRPDPRIGIGLCYWFLERKDLANQSWQNSIQVNPLRNLEAKILISMAKFDDCFQNSKSDDEFKLKYEESMEFAKASYKEDPSNQVIHIIFSSYFFSTGDYEKVKNISQRIIDDPNSPSFIQSEALFWTARCLLVDNDVLQAQKTFSQAIKLNENNTLARIGYSQCLVIRGEINDAIRTFEAVQNSNPKIIEVFYALGMLYSKNKKFESKSISFLEKYVKISKENNDHISISALLTLSRLYQEIDLSKSLHYLEMVRDEEIANGKSSEELSEVLLNNIGVFSLLESKVTEAENSFENALKIAKDKYKTDKNPIEITLKYNIARAKETNKDPKSVSQAMKIYEDIINECPKYTSARIRWLIISCLSDNKNINEEVNKLLEDETSDLQVRSFYGWYIKRFGKRNGLKGSKDMETDHHKETLTKYTSHDCYALVSLANVYLSLARELKDISKKDQYYGRAAQLYHKVLDIDSKNVYAAQGIAIILAEKKQTGLALEFFRKVRDSLNDITVYLNLGHCLVEAKQFAKAIESYQLALTRFTNGKDARLLNYFGRAWFLRGVNEKNLDSLKMALKYATESYELSKNSSYQFNITFIQYHIADFIRKLPSSKRNSQDLIDCIKGISDAIKILKTMADNEKHPPYPKEELLLRAEMGETILKQLEKVLEEQKEHDIDFENKLKQAKRIKEEDLKRKNDEKIKEEEEMKSAEDKLIAQRKELEEQQQEWNRERQEQDLVNDDEVVEPKKKRGRKKKDEDADEDATIDGEPKPKKTKKTKGAKVQQKKSSLSNEMVEDSDDEAQYSVGEEEEEDGEAKSSADEDEEPKPEQEQEQEENSKEDDESPVQRKKAKIIDDEDDEEEEDGLF